MYRIKMFRLCGGFLLMLNCIAILADTVPAYNKQDGRALFAKAVSLSVDGDWLAAEKLFQKIVLSHPEWPEPKNNLAVAQLKLGKVEKAQASLEDAVTSLPSFKVAQENRKRLYDHAAAVAYQKVISSAVNPSLPQLQLLHELNGQKIDKEQINYVSKDDLDSKQALSSAIEKSVLFWSKAWADVNITQYLSAYSSQFIPADMSKDFTQWSDSRRAKFRFTDDVQVDLENIKIYLADNEVEAVAEFIQAYKSKKYRDRVVKQLHMILENDRWLIKAERTLKKLN